MSARPTADPAGSPNPARESRARESRDLITVAIPARNEEEFIGRCLDSILVQEEANLQIIVVDGASDDATARIARHYSDRDTRVEVLHNPELIIPKSLNLALAAAGGRWFVRVDAHATIPTNYVRLAVSHLRSGQWGGVGGRKDGVGVTPTGRAIAAALGSMFGVGNSTYHYGRRMRTVDHIPFGAYPTELLRELGGWNEDLTANEDFELDYRLQQAGYRLLFDPRISIRWYSRETIAGLFSQYRRYGRSKMAVVRGHPRSLRARHLVPPALVVAWLAAAVAGSKRRPLALAALAPYAVALTMASAWTARRVPGTRAKAAVPVAFLAMHLGWGVGFWEGAARSVLGGVGHSSRFRERVTPPVSH